MTPYYSNSGIQIFHADCRDILPTLAPVDLIVTDVAFEGISGGNSPHRTSPSGILKKNDGKIFTFNSIATAEYASLFYSVLSDPAHCYVMINNLNLEDALKDFREAGFGLHNVLPWIKNNATPNRWYMKDVELILFFRKGKAFPITDCGEKASCLYPNPRGKIHETEKPVSLLLKLCRNSSQPGQTVLDPFAGSGSTLLAAASIGRNAIGIEIDERYCELMVARIEGKDMTPYLKKFKGISIAQEQLRIWDKWRVSDLI